MEQLPHNGIREKKFRYAKQYIVDSKSGIPQTNEESFQSKRSLSTDELKGSHEHQQDRQPM